MDLFCSIPVFVAVVVFVTLLPDSAFRCDNQPAPRPAPAPAPRVLLRIRRRTYFRR